MKESQTFQSNCDYFFDFYKENIDSLFDKIVYDQNTVPLRHLKVVANTDKDKKINGRVYALSDKDTIFSVQYRDGLANGFFIRYEKQDTACIVSLKKGKKDGIQYYRSNQTPPIFIRQNFENGIPIGPEIETLGNKVIYCCNYKNGKKHGAEYKFYDSGELAWCIVNEEGMVKDGFYFRFNTEGEAVEKMIFKGGVLKETVKY